MDELSSETLIIWLLVLIDPTNAILPSFATALCLVWLLGKAVRQPSDASDSRIEWSDYRVAFGLVISVSLGVLLVQDELGLPSKYWHWLWLVGIVGFLAKLIPATSSWSSTLTIRLGVWALAAAVSAWLLVPTWSTLNPGRLAVGALFATYLAALTIAFEFATAKFSSKSTAGMARPLITTLAATCFSMAGAIAATSGLKYGELAAVIAASLVGCLLAHGWRTNRDTPLALCVPIAALLIGSAAFIGVIYPTEPLLQLLPLPFAPLSLLAANRFFCSSSWRDRCARYVVFAVVLVGLTLIAVL